MASNNIVPAHILRLYIWDLLELNNELGKVNGLVPIVPIADEPSLSDSGKAYMVYGYSENESTRTQQEHRGIFSLRVTAPTFAELTDIMNTISIAFENTDISTENVNIWSSNYTLGAFIGIRFTGITVSYVEGGAPDESEGGPVDGVINLSYRYITQQSVQLPVSGGLWQ